MEEALVLTEVEEVLAPVAASCYKESIQMCANKYTDVREHAHNPITNRNPPPPTVQ